MHIYAIPIDAANPQEVGIITEALAAESYRSLVPAYYEVVLKTRYSLDSQSSRMVDIIYNGAFFDMAFAYNSDLTYYSGAVRNSCTSTSAQYSSLHKKLISTATKKLNTLIDGVITAAEASK